MSVKNGFSFKRDKCIGCATCQVACKEKNNLPPGINFRKVTEVAGGGYKQKGQGFDNDVFTYYISAACRHCPEPLCLKSCVVEAIIKRQDGIVIIDQNKCTRCRSCIRSCPYEAIQYDDRSQTVIKCDFCVDLIELGELPACVAACPMRALRVAD